MGTSPTADRRAGATDYALFLLGVAGLAAAITVVVLGARAVMAIGGYCAEGGPYQIEVHCPQGVPELIVGGVFGGIGCAWLVGARGAVIGGSYARLVVVAWPALFGGLGISFLQYGVFPPWGGGLELGFLIPGVVLLGMAVMPLFGVFSRRERAAAGGGQVRVVDRGLVDELERLATLYQGGSLTGAEYEAAKAALLHREAGS